MRHTKSRGGNHKNHRCPPDYVDISPLSYDQANWPADEEWDYLLPQWFVTQCAPEMSEEELADWLGKWKKLSYHSKRKQEQNERIQWALLDWIYWFCPDSSERLWQWWGSKVINDNEIQIIIECFDFPIPHDALIWLCHCAEGVVK